MESPLPQRLTVRIDRNKCVGSTMCVQIAPGAFGLNERKQATVKDATAESAARLLSAAEQCPMSAIILEDADTGRRIFP